MKALKKTKYGGDGRITKKKNNKIGYNWVQQQYKWDH